tara:strand:+ start:2712 stop:3536 length:825 start_codon:yes stop_codon:yes gene_type:complete
MIDTLILPGASSKGVCYIGALFALEKNNIINRNNIKNVLACSSGSIFGLMFILNYSYQILYKIIKKIDLIDLDNFNENEMFLDNGIINNERLTYIIKILIKYKYYKTDITFKELYEKTKVKFIIKVYNLSLLKEEYIDYTNSPDFSVVKTIQMSTCIPIIFKPIKYKNYFYIDGGIRNHIPFINKTEYYNYLIIIVHKKIESNLDYNKIDIDKYFDIIFSLLTTNKTIHDKKFINIFVTNNMNILNFKIYDLINNLIQDSITQTEKHIKKYYLT